MLVDLSKKEINVIMSSLMNDDTTHTELYEKLSNLNQVCTCTVSYTHLTLPTTPYV